MTPNKQPEWEEVAEKWLEKESVRVSVLTDLQTLIKEIITSRDTYWKEQIEKAREEERERIIYVTKNIKDAFMSPLTERRWLQCIQFTDQPKPKDQSELDQPNK